MVYNKSSDRSQPENQQNILSNSNVEGSLTTGDIVNANITQNLFVELAETPQAIDDPHNIPYRGTINFLGRTQELELLKQKFNQTDCIVINAIAGMGGVGKTELAIQYALARSQDYPGGICWIEGGGKNIEQQIIDFGKVHLNLNFSKAIKDLDSSKQVSWCWQHWREGKVLVIFDNVNLYSSIKPYLPPSNSRFQILITSRSRLLTSTQRLELKTLKLNIAVALLESFIGRERLQKEKQVAEEICKWLGRLPLGLELVGRYLERKPNLSLSEMLQRLEAKGLGERSLEKSKFTSDITAQWGVKEAFELSWQELSPLAQDIGCLLCIFALVPIPWKLVEECLSRQDLEDLEEARDDFLVDLHLIQRDGNEKYKLHELIREFFQNKLVIRLQPTKLSQAVALKIGEIARRNPIYLGEILQQKLLDWNVDSVKGLSAKDLTQQLLTIHQSLSDGLGLLANLVLPLKSNGDLPVLGYRVADASLKNGVSIITYLQTGWYYGDAIDESVVQLPSEAEKLFDDEQNEDSSVSEARLSNIFESQWNNFIIAPTSSVASCDWHLTYQNIRIKLSELIKYKTIPVSSGHLSLEAAWYGAICLTRRHLLKSNHYCLYSDPIPLDEIEAKLSLVENSNYVVIHSQRKRSDDTHHIAWLESTLLNTGIFRIHPQSAQSKEIWRVLLHYLDQLRIEIKACRELGKTRLSLPYPIEDFRTNMSLCPDRLLDYTKYIFESAIESYQQIVNTTFSNIAHKLPRASILPAKIIGYVIPPKYTSDSVSAGWHWERVPENHNTEVKFKIIENESDRYRANVTLSPEELANLQPVLFPQGIKQTPFSSSWLGYNPVTEIVYGWLKQDLEDIGLLEQDSQHIPIPYWC